MEDHNNNVLNKRVNRSAKSNRFLTLSLNNRYESNGYETVPPYSKDPIPSTRHRKSKCGKNHHLAKGL